GSLLLSFTQRHPPLHCDTIHLFPLPRTASRRWIRNCCGHAFRCSSGTHRGHRMDRVYGRTSVWRFLFRGAVDVREVRQDTIDPLDVRISGILSGSAALEGDGCHPSTSRPGADADLSEVAGHIQGTGTVAVFLCGRLRSLRLFASAGSGFHHSARTFHGRVCRLDHSGNQCSRTVFVVRRYSVSAERLSFDSHPAGGTVDGSPDCSSRYWDIGFLFQSFMAARKQCSTMVLHLFDYSDPGL